MNGINCSIDLAETVSVFRAVELMQFSIIRLPAVRKMRNILIGVKKNAKKFEFSKITAKFLFCDLNLRSFDWTNLINLSEVFVVVIV